MGRSVRPCPSAPHFVIRGRTAWRSVGWEVGGGELLDPAIILNERHLKRLMTEYVRYYHEDWTHLGLAKDTPVIRPILLRSTAGSKIRSFPRLGGTAPPLRCLTPKL